MRASIGWGIPGVPGASAAITRFRPDQAVAQIRQLEIYKMSSLEISRKKIVV
jgi:hypothetical protein